MNSLSDVLVAQQMRFLKQSFISQFEVVEESIKMDIWSVFAVYAYNRWFWTQLFLDGRIKRSRHLMGDMLSMFYCHFREANT